VQPDGTDFPDPKIPSPMAPERLSLLLKLVQDAEASNLPESESPKGDVEVKEITPEAYSLMMQAPDLAQELLSEREWLRGLLDKVREHGTTTKEVLSLLSEAGL
tara:strand:- start:146 stop:457 length:312 start_codon:yes stop_codon:yes gene_type:complete